MKLSTTYSFSDWNYYGNRAREFTYPASQLRYIKINYIKPWRYDYAPMYLRFNRCNHSNQYQWVITSVNYWIGILFNIYTSLFSVTVGLPSSTNPYKEMCIMNILWIMENVEPVASTNAYLRGSCTEEQSGSFPIESTQLFKDNPILNLHAQYGNQTGTIAIDSSRSVNLVNPRHNIKILIWLINKIMI